MNPAFSVGGSSTGPGMGQYTPTADLNLRAAKQAVSGNKVAKFVTGHDVKLGGKKYKKVSFKVLNVDNNKKEVKITFIEPKELENKKSKMSFRFLRRGPFVATKIPNYVEGRNYRKEYDNYQSKPEQIEKRSSRNKAARSMGAKKGMDVHHKDNNPLNNDPKNLEHLDISTNRREPRLREKSQKYKADVHYQYMTYMKGRRKHYVASAEGDSKKQAIDKAMKIYKSDRNVKRGHNAEVDKVVTKKI